MLDALLLAVVMLDPPARAEALGSFPLHELVAQSDLVAVVLPRAPQHGVDANGRSVTRVELVVEEVLKGRAVGSVTTEFSAGAECPAPPAYPAGVSVLAFLAQDAQGGWYTFAESEGTKLLEPAALAVYGARIRELVRSMESLGERWHASPEFVEWLVRCAEEPATRWEGAYALDPARPPFGHEPEWSKGLGHRLDTAQKERLARALFAALRFGEGEECLLSLFLAEPGCGFEDFALAQLPALVPGRVDLAGEIMLRLASRSGDAQAQHLAHEFAERPPARETSDAERERSPDDLRRSLEAFVQHMRQLR